MQMDVEDLDRGF